MSWHPFDTWIIVIGVLCAVSCALPGTFLVLRKMSMMGDAISHAVLPGLALAFLLTASRSSVPMFVGAVAAGILTALFTGWIGQAGRVERGAAMGIVFTTLFALGLLLMVQAADRVDLDPSCVLYGAIELAPLDVANTVHLGPWMLEVPRAVWVLLGALTANLLFLTLFFKELTVTSFDPAFSATAGFRPALVECGLMGLVALTAVAAFEVVGSILVIAMLIVPGATARLLSDRLGITLVWSAVLAAAAAVLGHTLAIVLPERFGLPPTSTSGMMAVACGLLFLVALLVRRPAP